MTRRMCRRWMQALMSMTSLMTISGWTLNTLMESAICPGIHTSFLHQRKCCRPSRTRSARFKRAKPPFSQMLSFLFLFLYSTSSPTIKGHVIVKVDYLLQNATNNICQVFFVSGGTQLQVCDSIFLIFLILSLVGGHCGPSYQTCKQLQAP